jgi:hypothetical protein
MANTKPGIRFTGFYYREIKRTLLQALRFYLGDFKETDEHDPLVALASAVAFVKHRYSVSLDRVAESRFWPTFATRAELIALSRANGIEVRRETPATVDLVAKLSAPVGVAGATVLTTGALCATKKGADVPAVEFEYLGPDVVATQSVLTMRKYSTAGGFAVFAPSAAPFSTPAVVAEDALYLGHPELMFDAVTWACSAPWDEAAELSLEYLDAGKYGLPDAVVDNHDGTLTITVTTALLTDDAWRTGLSFEIVHRASGARETVTMVSGSRDTVVTASYLGQTTPSEQAGEYDVVTTWSPLANIEQTRSNTAQGSWSWTLPQTTTRNWSTTVVNGIEAYWIRIRVAKVTGTVTPPTLTALGWATSSWYVAWEATQGHTVSEQIGTATEAQWQTFDLPTSGYVHDSVSEVQVGTDATWAEIESLYTADENTKAFEVGESVDEVMQLRFGNGTNGVMPTAAEPVYATYRVGATENGNVAALTIRQARSGVLRASAVYNPREASGWSQSDGADDNDIERMRLLGPASKRMLTDRATSRDDYEVLAVRFVASDGSRPVARCIAVENGGGVETVLLVCVGPAGASLTTDHLRELETYFNGQQVDQQVFGGAGVVGVRAVACNYVPAPISVALSATFIMGNSSGKEARIKAAVTAVLYPGATMADLKIALGMGNDVTSDDFASYLWRRGGSVATERISSVVYSAAGAGLISLTGLTLNLGTVAIVLADNELPYPGTITPVVTETTGV